MIYMVSGKPGTGGTGNRGHDFRRYSECRSAPHSHFIRSATVSITEIHLGNSD
jgi:hypothetical protein